MTIEEWKPAFEVPGYEVSSLGKVRRSVPIRNGKKSALSCVKPRMDARGFAVIAPYKNGRQRTMALAALVFRTFVGPLPSHRRFIYIDGDRANCAVANLALAQFAYKALVAGDQVGKWTLVKLEGTDNRGVPFWLCQCNCGTERRVSAGHLASRASQSCGCTFAELRALQIGDKHPGWKGGCEVRGSLAWSKIRLRILNSNAKAAGEIPLNATPEDVRDLWAKAGERCEVCGAADSGERSLSIDHDHQSGQLRGVLCAKCNSAIGMAGDSPERLRQLADYIESSRISGGKVRAS